MASVRAEIGELAGVSTRRSTVVLLTIAAIGAAISVAARRVRPPPRSDERADRPLRVLLDARHEGVADDRGGRAGARPGATGGLDVGQAAPRRAGAAMGRPRPPLDRHRGVPRDPARRLPLPVVDRVARARCPRVRARTARLRVLRRAHDRSCWRCVSTGCRRGRLPTLGGGLVALLLGIWSTSSLWYFTNVGFPAF